MNKKGLNFITVLEPEFEQNEINWICWFFIFGDVYMYLVFIDLLLLGSLFWIKFICYMCQCIMYRPFHIVYQNYYAMHLLQNKNL